MGKRTHRQMPADATIAAGEHMDLDAQADALQAEIDAGALNPTGVVLHRPSASGNPNVTEEMQGMQMTPKIVGPPQYGSPDPASAAGKLMALEDGHPFAGLPKGSGPKISENYGKDAMGSAVSDDEEIDATDAARALAEEHGIALESVEGSGEDGRITKHDVEKAVEAAENGD